MTEPVATVVCCPVCDNESLVVDVTDSGQSYDVEFGQTVYWVQGEGRCTDCGYEGPYGDSSL